MGRGFESLQAYQFITCFLQVTRHSVRSYPNWSAYWVHIASSRHIAVLAVVGGVHDLLGFLGRELAGIRATVVAARACIFIPW